MNAAIHETGKNRAGLLVIKCKNNSGLLFYTGIVVNLQTIWKLNKRKYQ